jgi:hypothetical protein
MSTAARSHDGPRARSVEITGDLITAYLVGGRVISVPLAWSWRLFGATPDQRRRYDLIGDGEGIRWPDVDEDISVRGMLDGTPASRSSRG